MEVHGHRTFAQVDGLEGPGDAFPAEVAGNPPEVAGSGLALDDEGAVVGKEAGGERSRPVLRDLGDDEAVQGSPDWLGKGGEEGLADGLAGRVRSAAGFDVFDAEGKRR